MPELSEKTKREMEYGRRLEAWRRHEGHNFDGYDMPAPAWLLDDVAYAKWFLEVTFGRPKEE